MLKKFLIGTFAVAVLFVGVSALTAKVASAAPQAIVTVADIQYAATVRLGSTGQASLIWQNFLNGYSTTANLVADGKFGPLSTVQAKAWQASRGLENDGILGALSRASAMAQITSGAPASAFPAGCTSTAGYSSVTGLACAGVALPAGCTAGALFSATTGLSCTGAAPVVTGALTGGAGDAEFAHYATSEKSTMSEGQEAVKVLGFKVEAIDSDISVDFVKVEVSNTHSDEAVVSSEKLSNYVDSVDIYKGSTKVGSADAADFTRTSATHDLYTKTIDVSDSIVREGDKDPFYVVFNANSTIDSEDMDAELLVEVASLRFQDATGVVFTNDTPVAAVTNLVTLDATSTQVDLKSSSNNPDNSTVIVDDANTTNDELALAFKMEAADDSMDVKIDEIPLNIHIIGAGAGVVSSESVIDSILVKIDGNDYNADVTTPTLVAGHGDAVYTVDLNDEDVTLSAGDILEVKVYITFAEQKDNYADGLTIVTASVSGTEILMESDEEDNLDVEDGTQTGADLTLGLTAPTVTYLSKSAEVSDNTKTGYIGFEFKVAATDGEVEITATSNSAVNTNGTGDDVKFTVLPSTTVTAASFTLVSGDATYGGGHWTIADGDDATFALDVTLTSVAGGTYRVRLDSVEGVTLDNLSAAVNLIAA